MKTKLLTILAIQFCLEASAQVCFSPVTNYPAANFPYSITSADFNNDGKLDLAVANHNSFNL